MNSNENIKLNKKNMPDHIAVIMDGNGRWAKKRLLNRLSGHKKGTETVRKIVEAANDLDISVLSLYAFSTENWKRPKTEITALMRLLYDFLNSETENLIEKNIKLISSGQIFRLPENVQASLKNAVNKTRENSGMILNLALSYGGREEITRAVKKISAKVKEGVLSLDDIDENFVSAHLYTKNIPDPDLVIRTGCEMRLSNFFLWQVAYSELYISETMWPDFKKEEFFYIIKDFQMRERRFGGRV